MKTHVCTSSDSASVAWKTEVALLLFWMTRVEVETQHQPICQIKRYHKDAKTQFLYRHTSSYRNGLKVRKPQMHRHTKATHNFGFATTPFIFTILIPRWRNSLLLSTKQNSHFSQSVSAEPATLVNWTSTFTFDLGYTVKFLTAKFWFWGASPLFNRNEAPCWIMIQTHAMKTRRSLCRSTGSGIQRHRKSTKLWHQGWARGGYFDKRGAEWFECFWRDRVKPFFWS